MFQKVALFLFLAAASKSLASASQPLPPVSHHSTCVISYEVSDLGNIRNAKIICDKKYEMQQQPNITSWEAHLTSSNQFTLESEQSSTYVRPGGVVRTFNKLTYKNRNQRPYQQPSNL